MRLQGEHQTIGFFAFVDVPCEDNCPLKCHEGEMPGIFSIDAFGNMELRLQYTGYGPCLNYMFLEQAEGRLRGFRMYGYLHAPLSIRKPNGGVDNHVTFEDCGVTNPPLLSSALVNEITISVGYAIEREQIDGDVSFSEFTIGLDGLLQWVGVNSIDVHDMQRNWKIEPKYTDPISYQLEDVRIEFVPTNPPPSGYAPIPGGYAAVPRGYAAIPEKYTVRQGMLVRFVYSDKIPIKTLMESMREFRGFLAFALNQPVMVRSAMGSYPEDDSNNPIRPIYFPARRQHPEIDTTRIYKGDGSSLFVYDQLDDFVKTFTAWRKLRSEVRDPFFGSVVDMYLECMDKSRLVQDQLVDYLKIIELMQRKFMRMDESELRQWNWDLGPFPQERDLMVAPYWDKFFLSLLKEIKYASTPKKFGETARTLRDAVVHPVGAAEKLKEIGINEGDNRAPMERIMTYFRMYERLVQLYLVTFLGLDPIKLADEGNLFASRALGRRIARNRGVIGDIVIEGIADY